MTRIDVNFKSTDTFTLAGAKSDVTVGPNSEQKLDNFENSKYASDLEQAQFELKVSNLANQKLKKDWDRIRGQHQEQLQFLNDQLAQKNKLIEAMQ